MKLPPPSPNQACISLSLLSGGYLHLPGKLFVNPASEDETLVCPSMSWLLTHEPSNTKLIFDLGLRKDIENYTPAVYHRLRTLIPVDVDEDVFASLDAAGIDPKMDIDTVIFSHLHYDHIGDPSRFGAHTTFTIGPDASRTFLESDSSYPHDKNSHFDSHLLPKHQINQLPPPSEGSTNDNAGFWQPLGPFPAAHDVFADSSLYIIDAPGHLTGHINLLVRTGPDKWMYLAGDTAHDPRILDGSRKVAVYPDPHHSGKFKCAHADRDAAERHLARVRALPECGDVEVVLAHDAGWLERNGKRFRVGNRV